MSTLARDDADARSSQFLDAPESDVYNSTQSLASNSSIGQSLWKAVRDRVQATAALQQSSSRRSSRYDQDGRIDAEGLSSHTFHSQGTDSTSPGQHANNWQSLAHLFDEGAFREAERPVARSKKKRASSARPRSQSRRRVSQYPSASLHASATVATRDPPFSDDGSTARDSDVLHRGRSMHASHPSWRRETALGGQTRPTVHEGRISPIAWRRIVSPPPEAEASNAEGVSHSRNDTSISDEPPSWLSNDPDDAPEGEDPLLYTSQDTLLDSDSGSDSDSSITDPDLDDVKRSSALVQIRERSEGQSLAMSLKGRLSGYRAAAVRSTRLTPPQRNIVKCVIAYFVASLFTFSPTLSSNMARLLPNHDPDARVPFSNLHMIATVAVYFHPAKTLGAMLEADFFALIAFTFAVALGLSSMAIAVFLHEADMLFVSDILSVLFFLGFGMALVGYAKVKVGKAQFNTACSLICIIVFTVVVKEGSKNLGHFSFEKTYQVTLVVIAGSLIANLVCFLFWPQSATTNLQNDLVRNLQGFATLLRVLTKTFLLDDPSNFHFKSEKIKRAIDDHHQSFTSLKKNLAEAILEAPFDLRMKGMQARYIEATDSMNRLAQHLAGLRSSCGLQHQIMMTRVQARRAGEASTEPAIRISEALDGAKAADVSEALLHREHGAQGPDGNETELGDNVERRARAFEDFIESVGPHMRSLVFTCSRTLKNLCTTFVAKESPSSEPPKQGFSSQSGQDDPEAAPPRLPSLGSRFKPGHSFDILSGDISSALHRFEHEQTAAIKRIYTMEPKKMEAEREAAQRASACGKAADLPPQAFLRASPDEEIFLIFFFVFNLEEFAKELEMLIESLEALRQGEERIAEARATSLWSRIKLFASALLPSWHGPLRRRQSGRSGSGSKRQKKAVRHAEHALDFPSNRRHTINTAQTPAALTFKQRFQRLVWSLGEFLRQADTKFAIKAGAGSALLASPAFFDLTRPTFTKFQGQWALVSFMVVLSPTLGQSNQMSFHRFLGTMIGASAAVGVYKLFPDNNVVLPLFGGLFSLPCFKYILGKPQYASGGRFVLLTYNLTALYSYNLRKVGIEVEQIAFQRTVSVLVGVLWATVLNQLVWPFEARRELALGVSDLIFKLAWLYQRLVLSYSEDPNKAAGSGAAASNGGEEDENAADDDIEWQPLLKHRQAPVGDEFQAIELHLQVTIIKLEGLLAQTKHEPRLKGPFPVATYRSMLGCCQNILDKLHSMRCVTSRDDWYREVRRDFVIPVNPERREMVGNVLLFFYTLGSAFHLKIPLPPYFPPASDCRLRLLQKIRELPAVKRRAVRGSSAYLLFYSYALAMGDVIDQLEELGRLTQHNFGIWGGSLERFESCFEASPESAIATPYMSRRASWQATGAAGN
ncbi:hypothetical protein ACQY0O_004455 [Thecaphora frezii]